MLSLEESANLLQEQMRKRRVSGTRLSLRYNQNVNFSREMNKVSIYRECSPQTLNVCLFLKNKTFKYDFIDLGNSVI